MTATNLNQLTKYGNYFFSDIALPLHRQLNATCLGTIFSQNFENIRSTCPARFMQVPELFVSISPGEYWFYSSKPQTLQVQCKRNTTYIAVQHSSKLVLKDNCEVRSEHFITRTGHNVQLDAAVNKWPSTWNISDLLFDMDCHSLEEIVQGLQLIRYPDMPIRDLHLLLHSTSHNHHWWTAAIGTLAALLTLLMGFLCFRYWRLRKSLPVAATNEEAANAN